MSLESNLKNLVSPKSPLQRWIDPILGYAAIANVDRVWFLGETRRVIANSIDALRNGFSEEELKLLSDPDKPPRHHWEFYELAIEAISRNDRVHATDRLKLAEDVARQGLAENPRQDKQNEHLVYHWSQKQSFPILDDLQTYELGEIEADLDQMRANLNQYRYRNLLQARVSLYTEEAQTQERQQIEQAEADYKRKSQPLLDELERLKKERDAGVTRAKEPRLQTERALLDALSAIITIGRHPERKGRIYDVHETYEPYVRFGFDEGDAISMLNYALERGVDPEVFLRHCETTRAAMEHTWGSNWNRKDIITEDRGYLFPEHDKEEIPVLREVDEQYRKGLRVLIPPFLTLNVDHEQARAIEQAGPHFTRAQKILDAVDDSRRSISYFLATSVFLEFMRSEQASVFAKPTARKYHFEEYSHKEK